MPKPIPFFACITLALNLIGAPVLAQSAADYPTRRVTFIIPFTPGSSTEVAARVYTNALTENLQRQFVIDFKPGAGSTIGTNFVAKAPPDGYTLLFFTSSFLTSAAVYKNLPYDPIGDFAPVSLLSKRPLVLVVNPQLPFHSVKDYLAFVRANPGKVNVSTPGSGTASHFASALLYSLTATQVTFIHYKGGAGQLLDLIAGRNQATVVTLESAMPHLKSGKLRPLGITTREHIGTMPTLRPLAELGVPDYEYSGGLGVLAPRGTPRPIVQKLSGELARVAKSREVARRMEGSFMVGSPPEELAESIAASIKRFKEIAREAGIASGD